eukprot:IDg7528t1
MYNGHSGEDVSKIIETVVVQRLSKKIPRYFESDSAPVNRLADMVYMNDTGDEYWFSFAVHFCQLAMKDAVREYLSAPDDNSTNKSPSESDES